MKKSVLALAFLVTFFAQSTAFAQGDAKLTYYVGVGPAIDGDIGLYGLNFSNELSFKLGERTSVNPSLTFYQSIKSFDNYDDKNLEQDNSSGLFTNATFKYDLLKTKKNFRISLAVGPSFQIGSENYWVSTVYGENDQPDHRYSIERFSRLGYTQQIAFDWKSKNENRRNSAVVSMSSFDGYWPWYLMATYRIGFKLK
ncbi:hypothetical protein GCM10009119_15780 [Algoriphagus jejuensis]|uniref:Outer membrane protein with beta-barrel domain n=1 Tax=Algoriphagus jejuensis TaxID=419934 RepID=A0ABN1MYL5_9BACT